LSAGGPGTGALARGRCAGDRGGRGDGRCAHRRPGGAAVLPASLGQLVRDTG